jgi:NADH-quinone oxidoreductase subunit H
MADFLYVLFSLAFVAFFTLAAVYAERKVSAFVQDRMGPMETGPYGLLQTLADVLKLVLKEPLIPSASDKLLFRLAPALIFVPVFAGYALLPLAPGLAAAPASAGVLLLLAVVAADVLGMLMAGWGAGNKYAMLGAMRAVAQIVSYEVPAVLALLAGLAVYGSMNLQAVSEMQGLYSPEPVRWLGIWDISAAGGLPAWGIFRYPHLIAAFLVYFIASLAECNRAPFDLPEAESELVAGFHTEYGGQRFALVFLAEYGKMFLVSALASVVFLGGWNTALPNLRFGEAQLPLAAWTSGPAGSLVGAFWGLFWLLLKSLALVFLQMWVRWSYPRLRADQLMSLCWKYLTPAALILLLISIIWRYGEIISHL